MHKLLNLSIILAMVFGLLATVPAAPVLADCEDGTPGPDVLLCDTNPPVGGNTNSDIDGDAGNDGLTLQSGVTVNDISGDGEPDGTSGDANGGNDTILVNGSVGNDLFGDFVAGNGGDDIITVNGSVGDDVRGDLADGNGGVDIITINGSVADEVSGDFADGNGGNDTIIVNGTVWDSVYGDDAGGDGGDDTIIVNGIVITDVLGDSLGGEGSPDTVTGGTDAIDINGSAFFVAGDSIVNVPIAYGGNDQISIAGTATWVEGDSIFFTELGEDYYAEGGDDTIVASGTAIEIAGDGIYNYDYAYGGNDNLSASGNGVEFVVGDRLEYNYYAYGGDDVLVVDGSVYSTIGDLMFFNDYAEGGDDTITINGNSDYVYGDSLYNNEYAVGGNDTITVNGTVWVDVYGDGIGSFETLQGPGLQNSIDCVAVICEESPVASDTIVVNGVVGGNVIGDSDYSNSVSDGYGGDDTITVNGLVGGDVIGDNIYGCEAVGYGGNDTFYINGDVSGWVIGDSAFFECNGHLQGANVQTNGVEVSNSDNVYIGAGGVSYSTSCGDFNVTTVNRRQGTVGGVIDGDFQFNGKGSFDGLTFDLLTASSAEADTLAAQLAALDPEAGSATIGGSNYTWQNFESLNVRATFYKEGATKVYDDGMTLAFATAGGVAVCHGPSGLRAANIDFIQVTNGQREFGLNGFIVKIVPTGNGNNFTVHVYLNGVEQINDANHDGVADSLFVFGF